MKKVLFSAAFMLAAAISFAGTPKGETKDAKANSSTEVKADDETFTYYVTAQSGTNYTLSTVAPPQCNSGTAYPCEIQSDIELPSSVQKSVVDSGPHVTIMSRRASL